MVGLVEWRMFRTNPGRLQRNAFKESSVTVPHPIRGWTQKPNISFRFFHGYMPDTVEVSFNNFGKRDTEWRQEEKKLNEFRIGLFGDTYCAGYEQALHETAHIQLQKLLMPQNVGGKISVFNFSERNYSIDQLYSLYKEEGQQFDLDLIIYCFNSNHPRRAITFHEALKEKELTKPVYKTQTPDSLELTFPPEIRNNSDLVYLNENGVVTYESARENCNPYRWLRNNSYVINLVDEIVGGPVSLRLQRGAEPTSLRKNEHLAKPSPKPEHQSELTNYQWTVTAEIIQEWCSLARENMSEMMIFSVLGEYNGRQKILKGEKNRRVLGNAFDQIPERLRLPAIAQQNNVYYFDSFLYARDQELDTEGCFINPGYGYLTPAGTRMFAELLSVAIKDGSRSFQTYQRAAV